MSEASQETQMAPREAETKTAPTATIAPTEAGQLHVDTPATAAEMEATGEETILKSVSYQAAKNGETMPLLEVVDLEVAFRSTTGMVPAVRKVNFTIYPGQTIAIVGESGSGKSTAAAAIIGLLPGTGKIVGGKILFRGHDITTLNKKQQVALRGSHVGMVPQDPMSNLNPVWKIGFQVKEALTANRKAKGREDERVVELLEEAGLPNATRRVKQYPHEFSGGMRQRALIAIGFAGEPQLLIADEPTSALDVTVQRRILDHLATITEKREASVLFITHDLGLAAERASHLVVMHRGRVVESGPALDILGQPQHPYTQRLVSAAPSLASQRIQAAKARGETSTELLTHGMAHPEEYKEIIRAEKLTKIFDIRGAKGEAKQLKAVDEVSFSLRRGTTLALVGESGSGKSTVANIILNLINPTSGKVYYQGTDLSTLGRRELFDMRAKLQVVFQNPYASLNPMFSVYRCIEEPLLVHHFGGRKEREERVAQLLDAVALLRSAMRRYPGELSGGQRQRVAIARALALRPEIIVLDEAVSALDVLVQEQILQLLADIQHDSHITYLFITHDLAVVRQMADEVVVMQSGRVVERGSVDVIFDRPQEAYTRDLIEAIPGRNIPLWNGD